MLLLQIDREFGSEVAQLVDGVTKIGKIQVLQKSPTEVPCEE